MPCWLFTYHGYGTWLPDNPRGYTVPGGFVLPSDPVMAQHYRNTMRGDAMEFGEAHQRILVEATRAFCLAKNVRLHYVVTVDSHYHALVSWRFWIHKSAVSDVLKRHLGSSLSKALDRPGPWFSRGGVDRRVTRRSHFDYLMTEYLPDHRGATWREDRRS